MACTIKENINVVFFNRQSINPWMDWKFCCESHHSPLRMGFGVTSRASWKVSLGSESLTTAGLLCSFLPASPQPTVSPSFLQCPEVPICSVVGCKADTQHRRTSILLCSAGNIPSSSFSLVAIRGGGVLFHSLFLHHRRHRCLALSMWIKEMPPSCRCTRRWTVCPRIKTLRNSPLENNKKKPWSSNSGRC